MLHLPTFTHLRIEGYGLFPGVPRGKGISWHFEKGVSLIAGVNGLGKTTLLTMLLRSFTGPFDLTSDGLPAKLESIVPESPIIISSRERRFFAQRVADEATNAFATLDVLFAESTVRITRRLSDLKLTDFIIDNIQMELGTSEKVREAAFQNRMCQLFNLSSFVDVLLVLHHIIFFKEGRTGALWDENAQRHILRAVVFPKDLAAQVAQGERRVQRLDSNARNISAAAYKLEQSLKRARAAQQDVSEKSLELASERALLEADLKQRERLDSRLIEIDDERRETRRELEQAKITHEEMESEVERIKFDRLQHLFPTMEEALRLVLLKALGTGECLVCGSNSDRRIEEVEQQLSNGMCPVCGTPAKSIDNVVRPHQVEAARIRKARASCDRAIKEEHAKRNAHEKAKDRYNATLAELITLRDRIQDREAKAQMLAADIPPTSEEIKSLEQTLLSQRREQRRAESDRALAGKELQGLLERGRSSIENSEKKLTVRFQSTVKAMISEDADLVRIEAKAKITQGGKEIFRVPAFVPTMTAADKSGKSRRNAPEDVSESQRELIDLAFRFALIEIATGGASCTLTMETPEASLDGIAMNRVGKALYQFASTKENRLIATSNLSNTGMITAMFGGPTKKATEIASRKRRVMNLLEVAAPNRAVLEHRSEYRSILNNALAGKK